MRKIILITAIALSSSFAVLANGKSITVMQYNILAAYLGNNLEPWFLYGADITNQDGVDKRRAASKKVMDLMYEKYTEGEKKGEYKNKSLRVCMEIDPTLSENAQCTAYNTVFSRDEIAKLNDYQQHFSWDNRKEKIVNEIRNQQPDILSLVELDGTKEVRDYIAEELNKDDGLKKYDFKFFKRPRDNSLDGAGIFYDKTRFLVKDSLELPYNDKDRVALLVRFEDTQSDDKKNFIFVSTHLMREPDDLKRQEPIRVEEVAKLIATINQFKKGEDLRVIVAGDFNAYPENESVKNMMKANYTHPIFPDSQKCTSKTLMRNAWIDYIFTQGFSKTESRPKTVDCDDLSVVWPNAAEGSDHVPVTAEVTY